MTARNGNRKCRRCGHYFSAHRFLADGYGPCRVHGCSCEHITTQAAPRLRTTIEVHFGFCSGDSDDGLYGVEVVRTDLEGMAAFEYATNEFWARADEYGARWVDPVPNAACQVRTVHGPYIKHFVYRRMA